MLSLLYRIYLAKGTEQPGKLLLEGWWHCDTAGEAMLAMPTSRLDTSLRPGCSTTVPLLPPHGLGMTPEDDPGVWAAAHTWETWMKLEVLGFSVV